MSEKYRLGAATKYRAGIWIVGLALAVAVLALVILAAMWYQSEPEIVKVTSLIERPLVVKEQVLVEVPGAATERPYSLSDVYQRVDFVFSAACAGEIIATQEALVNKQCFDFFSRPACIGEVPGLPGYVALAYETGAHPMGTSETAVRLGYHFPPRNGDKYLVYSHGGIAGGFYNAFVEGAPEMQPGDHLAAAGACGINSNIWQPYLTQGYLMAGEGDTIESMAERYTGFSGQGEELYDYNAGRLWYESPEDLQPGDVLLVPDTWEPKSLVNFGIPNGGRLFGGKTGRFRMPAQDPCIYLSAEALALRDQAVAEMDLVPLPEGVIEYRERNFPDARDHAVVYSGDWNEGSGWSWYGDPWIARYAQTFYHVAQGDMETFDHVAARWSWDSAFEDGRPVTDIIILRSSSDPPDWYRGGAFRLEDYLTDPDGVRAAVRAAYRGTEGADDSIPFGILRETQAAQLRNFSFTAARIAVGQ